MSIRNKKAALRRRGLRLALRRRQAAARRRGVLLLVVLSLLVLFSLLGTAFLTVSSSYRTSTKVQERAHRTSLQPGDVMERALMQVLRDTNNPHSSIRYHSLLRDMYGTDGFAGRVYAPNVNSVFGDPNAAADPAFDLLPRYARSLTDGASGPLGSTDGQLIDLYIDSATLQLGDATTVAVEEEPILPNDAGPFELELDNNGVRVVHQLPPTDGYYNGSLLTFTSGPASGQTTRIVDYDFVGDQPQFLLPNGNPSALFRLRVQAFARQDGAALQAGQFREFELGDLVDVTAVDLNNDGDTNDPTESPRFFGHSFIVSGRPFNGTGVGYNGLADIAAPRLTAGELLPDPSSPAQPAIDFLQVALSPNSRFTNVNAVTDEFGNPLGYTSFVGPGGPDESYDAPDFQNMFLAWQSFSPRSRGRVVDGSGALVEVAAGLPGTIQRLDLEDVTIPSFHRPALVNYWMTRLFRAPWLVNAIDNEAERARAVLQPFGPDMIPASGDEVAELTTALGAQIVAIKRKIMLRPLPEDHPGFNGSNPISSDTQRFNLGGLAVDQLRSLLLGGEITFPFWEATGPWDVDNDNDGVPDSIWVDLGMPVQKTEDGRFYKPLFAILVQDMDGRLNLNAHGSADQFTAPDLDLSRDLGGGALTEFNLPGFDFTTGSSVSALRTSNQLPPGSGWGVGDISLRSILSPDLLPADFGNANRDDYARLLQGRRVSTPGSLADPLRTPTTYGRLGGIDVNPSVGAGLAFDINDQNSIETRTKIDLFDFPEFDQTVGNFLVLSPNSPLSGDQQLVAASLGAGQPSAFGSTPDLRSRYGFGLSPSGGPLSEAASDLAPFPQVSDSPYETNLMTGSRREPPSLGSSTNNDFDSPFSVAELERLLRAFDSDAGRLPDRLWEVVDAFDPNKLAVTVGVQSGSIGDYLNSNGFTPDSAELVTAQLQAERNRRAVTNRSFDVPATIEQWEDRLRFGADGLPNTNDDYFLVMGADPPEQPRLLDYLRYRIILELTRQNVPDLAAFGGNANGQVDAFERIDDPAIAPALRGSLERFVSQIINGDNTLSTDLTRFIPPAETADDSVAPRYASFGGLIAPEVIAGLKMNLNRPFGDGRDNGDGIDNDGNGLIDDIAERGNNIDDDGDGLIDEPGDSGNEDPLMNGVVDEPQEAGEPFVDSNSNGVFDAGEPFLDLDGNNTFDPSRDTLFAEQVGAPVPFSHTNGQDANGRGTFVDSDNDGMLNRNNAGLPTEPLIRDDGRMARQLYARHLYCLMLLLMDENYLAPIDPTDSQALHYVNPRGGEVRNGAPTAASSPAFRIAFALGGANPSPQQLIEAEQIARRKLTVRRIAQWAINCVDARDPDVIQTPFEYDENPWDGWNVVDTANAQVYPLDGDLTTDENGTQLRQVTDASIGNPTPATPDMTIVSPIDQTRGVVWGAERPELLLTEGLAIHDRRQQEDLRDDEDEGDEDGGAGGDDGGDDNRGGAPQLGVDPDDQQGNGIANAENDLVQHLLPADFAFLEIHNPNGPDSQRPAELYRDPGNSPRLVDADNDGNLDTSIDPTTGLPRGLVEGVLLDRLSDATFSGERSPVWRVICVEEHPRLRNDSNVDDGQSSGSGPTLGASNQASTVQTRTRRWAGTVPGYSNFFQTGANRPPLSRPLDPDFPTFNQSSGVIGRVVGATGGGGGSNGTVGGGTVGDAGFLLTIPETPAYIEREAYFVAGARRPQRAVTVQGLTGLGSGGSAAANPNLGLDAAQNDQLREAERFHGLRVVTVGEGLNAQPAVLAESLPPVDDQDLDGDTNVDETIPLAPILPGHYGVIGSAGFSYGRVLNNPRFPGRYLSPIGRKGSAPSQGAGNIPIPGGGGGAGNGTAQGSPNNLTGSNDPFNNGHDPEATRRIEFAPDPNPYLHQVLIAENAGPEFDIVDPEGAGQKNINVTDPRMSDANSGLPEFANLKAFNDMMGDDASFFELEAAGNDQKERFPIRPVVAIPLEGFALSGRLDNYVGRAASLRMAEEEAADDPNEVPNRRFDFGAAEGEGGFVTLGNNGVDGEGSTPEPFDQPFDDPNDELGRDRTIPAYRTVHLQRLANPLLVWNPEPGEEGHEALLPVNPYLTVDSLAVDLSTVNGTAAPLGGLGEINRNGGLTFSSTQRGLKPNGDPVGPARSLWPQSERNTENDIRAGQVNPTADLLQINNPGTNDLLSRLAMEARPGQNNFVQYALRHTLGYANVRFTWNGPGADRFQREEALFTADRDNSDSADGNLDNPTYDIDLNGDGQGGDLIGVPQVDLANASTTDDATSPWLTWNNRPFASVGELLQVPASSASAMLRDFSVFNTDASGSAPPANPNPYDGDAIFNDTGGTAGELDAGDQRLTSLDNANAATTNAARFATQQAPFGHLLNFFQSGTRVSASQEVNGELVAAGAPNFHRLLDYVHVPSRFVGTDRLANPAVFNPLGPEGTPNTTDDLQPGDPRIGLLAPFNRLPEYREPGRVNLNTVVGSRTSPLDVSSPVYDGIMHRIEDGNGVDSLGRIRLGHRGPAWRDVVLSRRGYVDPIIQLGADLTLGTADDSIDSSAATLNPNVPTLFGNPFRASGEGDFVPIEILRQIGAESSLNRSHPYSAGADSSWGVANFDDNGDGIVDDASEAGFPGSDDFPLLDTYPDVDTNGDLLDRIRPGTPSPSGGTVPVTRALATLTDDPSTPTAEANHPLVAQPSTRVPLFSAADREPGIEGNRNSALRYAPITRLSNLVTTRSGVYAVWITVGFFEVEPAPDFNAVQAQFLGNRALYDRVYPDGYQLGAELGSETGDIQRFKSFYVIDRTLPVGFRPGDNLNVRDAVLLERRIE